MIDRDLFLDDRINNNLQETKNALIITQECQGGAVFLQTMKNSRDIKIT
jgi:hypothetical protein